jgi:cytochrome c heme-lyase
MNKDSSVAPASIEEAANHAQTPLPDQRISLRTERQISSIPRDAVEGGDGPHHQHDKAATNWVYPSEQQLYNAMRRKGWQNIPEDSIPLVLQIHNVINEGTWGKVVDWEGSPDVRLARFQGRPKDITPKAFFMSYVLGYYAPPFDRHDWYVEDPVRRPGELQRYVIDYYMIEPPPGSAEANLPPQPYVDARPAWEGPRGMSLRATRFLQDALPGISAYWNRFSAPRAAAGEQKKGG